MKLLYVNNFVRGHMVAHLALQVEVTVDYHVGDPRLYAFGVQLLEQSDQIEVIRELILEGWWNLAFLTPGYLGRYPDLVGLGLSKNWGAAYFLQHVDPMWWIGWLKYQPLLILIPELDGYANVGTYLRRAIQIQPMVVDYLSPWGRTLATWKGYGGNAT